jgi:transglutaminase-like putative cysteine protease
MKWIFMLVFFWVKYSYGQISSELNKYKEEYPDSHFVRLNQETKIKIELHKGAFDISEEVIEEDLFLDESATYTSEQSLRYSSFYEIESIEASSFILNNEKYEEIKVRDFKEKDELDDYFYDDSKTLKFVYPKLKQGARTKLRYIRKIKNPRFLGAFFFADFNPIEKNKLTIIADKNVQLSFKEINTENLSIEFSKKETRRKNIYTWIAKGLDQFEREENSPNYKSILPHIVPIINSYTINGERKKVLGEVADLYGWYYSLIENLNKETADKALVETVKRITGNHTSNLEKAKAIYYWAQENIKYIAFEYALGGFIPREANDVFKKKYGDCKDNSSIMHKMLEIAGIKSNLTWIGTRSIPYLYNEIPTPMVDNHMILSFEDEGRTYYLDATGRYNSIEIPTSFIQGKEALLGFGKDSFKIKTVPVIEPEYNSFKDISFVKLNGNSLKGRSEVEISGYLKINYFYMLEGKTNKNKIKDFYNSRFRKGNNSFLIENLSETNKFSYDDNFLVNYDFNISNSAQIIGNEIYINLNLNQLTGNLKAERNRKTPIEHDFKDFHSYQTFFKIPQGYEVAYLPKDVQISNQYFSGAISYILIEDQIHYQHSIKLHSLIFDLQAQKEVNELISEMEQAYNEVVILRKK